MATNARFAISGEANTGVGVGLDPPRPKEPPDAAGQAPSLPRGTLLLRLFTPVDISSLVFFRIAFGAIMFWEVWRYFHYGWIARYYVSPTFHFTYFGFEWVRPWPGVGMYVHFVTLGVLALWITVGFSYRLAATLFFLGFTYVFLLEQARYLNHLYLVSLVSFLMIFIPAHRAFSLDSRWRPAIRSSWAPAWALWLLRFQIALPYFYGGLAKLNADWLQGEPLRAWLAERAGWPVIGPLLLTDWAPFLFGYGGLLFDLMIVPLLLWRRTVWLGLAAAVAFNVMNAFLFRIGIFPWFMIAATLLFLPPEWPRSVVAKLRGRLGASRSAAEIERWPVAPTAIGLGRAHYVTVVLLLCWVGAQLLIPFRHFLYPGDVAWTEEGHRFSWRMKLRDKSGSAEFLATDSRGLTWRVDLRKYVTSWQLSEMVPRPDMVIQLAHHMANDLRAQGYQGVEMRARVMASLNGRRSQPLIDATVDLVPRNRSLLPADWITRPNDLLQPSA